MIYIGATILIVVVNSEWFWFVMSAFFIRWFWNVFLNTNFLIQDIFYYLIKTFIKSSFGKNDVII